MDFGERVNRNMPFPMDGTAFSTDQFLQSLVKYDTEFYRMYDRHLQYFTSLFDVEGNEDIQRIWPVFLRVGYEYGKVALAKHNDKFIVINVIEEKFTIDYKVKSIKGVIAPRGYGIIENQTTITFKAENVVFLKTNYNAFPFMFYWRDIIKNIINLRDAAITASIASIKKFKRNLQNNSSTIADIEVKSMLDPRKPSVDIVAQPLSYFEEDLQHTKGNMNKSDITNSTAPNTLTFESTVSDASGQWDNLKNYVEFEYYQNGRRVNTNKKNERNIAKEIDTETVNFDILENDIYRYLTIAISEINSKWGLSLKLVNKADEFTQVEEEYEDKNYEQ